MEKEIVDIESPVALSTSEDVKVVTTGSEEESTEVNQNGKRPLDQAMETTPISTVENGNVLPTNGHVLNDTPLQSSPIRPRLNINKQAKDDARLMTHSNEQRCTLYIIYIGSYFLYIKRYGFMYIYTIYL